jgi:hypothetical protein
MDRAVEAVDEPGDSVIRSSSAPAGMTASMQIAKRDIPLYFILPYINYRTVWTILKRAGSPETRD